MTKSFVSFDDQSYNKKITLPSEALKSTLMLLGVPTVAAAHGTKVCHQMALLDMINHISYMLLIKPVNALMKS